MTLPCLTAAAGGVYLDLQVQPRASRNALVGLQENLLKIRLTAPPVEGAANRACRDYFAKLFGVAKGCVTVAAGEKSRQKRLFIHGVDLASADQLLREQLN